MSFGLKKKGHTAAPPPTQTWLRSCGQPHCWETLQETKQANRTQHISPLSKSLSQPGWEGKRTSQLGFCCKTTLRTPAPTKSKSPLQCKRPAHNTTVKAALGSPMGHPSAGSLPVQTLTFRRAHQRPSHPQCCSQDMDHFPHPVSVPEGKSAILPLTR